MINRNNTVKLPILKYLTRESSLCILCSYRKRTFNISPKIQLERRGNRYNFEIISHFDILSLWNNKPESSIMKFVCLMILTIVIAEEFSLCQFGERCWNGIFPLPKLLINFVGFYVLIIIPNTCIWLTAILFYATIHRPLFCSTRLSRFRLAPFRKLEIDWTV